MNESTFTVRRENLRKLVLDRYDGNRAAFSRAAEVHQNQVNLLLTDNMEHRRNLGEALARKLEHTLGLTSGWLDTVHSAATAHLVPTLDVPAPLAGIFGKEDMLHSMWLYESHLELLEGRITNKSNLHVCRVATRDLDPEISVGDHLLIDLGAKAISVDGVYVVQNGTNLFLRRVTKLLTGGWVIHGGGADVTVDNLKGLKAVCKVVSVWKHTLV